MQKVKKCTRNYFEIRIFCVIRVNFNYLVIFYFFQNSNNYSEQKNKKQKRSERTS
jgi:hypothetical protein